MKLVCLILVLLCAGFAQSPQIPRLEGEDNRLPNGKSQREEILKAEHQKNLEDAAELLRLAGEVKADLEKSDRYVVSVKTLKETENIEKLAKNIRGRLKRY